MIYLSDEDYLYLTMSENRLGIGGLITAYTGKVVFESSDPRYSGALFEDDGKVGYAVMDKMWFWITDNLTGELEPFPFDGSKYGYDLSDIIKKERDTNPDFSRDNSTICVDKIVAKGSDKFDIYTDGVLNNAYFTNS